MSYVVTVSGRPTVYRGHWLEPHCSNIYFNVRQKNYKLKNAIMQKLLNYVLKWLGRGG